MRTPVAPPRIENSVTRPPSKTMSLSLEAGDVSDPEGGVVPTERIPATALRTCLASGCGEEANTLAGPAIAGLTASAWRRPVWGPLCSLALHAGLAGLILAVATGSPRPAVEPPPVILDVVFGTPGGDGTPGDGAPARKAQPVAQAPVRWNGQRTMCRTLLPRLPRQRFPKPLRRRNQPPRNASGWWRASRPRHLSPRLGLNRRCRIGTRRRKPARALPARPWPRRRADRLRRQAAPVEGAVRDQVWDWAARGMVQGLEVMAVGHSMGSSARATVLPSPGTYGPNIRRRPDVSARRGLWCCAFASTQPET